MRITVSALILYLVANLSPEMESAIAIFCIYNAKILAVRCSFSPVLAIFTEHAHFDHISTSGLKLTLYLNLAHTFFSIKTRSFPARDIFSATFETIMSARAHH